MALITCGRRNRSCAPRGHTPRGRVRLHVGAQVPCPLETSTTDHSHGGRILRAERACPRSCDSGCSRVEGYRVAVRIGLMSDRRLLNCLALRQNGGLIKR